MLELLAGASVYASYPASDFAGWDVVHYIDNTSALYSLSKGYSAKPDSLLIIRAFLALDLAIGANIWFNYVATKANVVDLPSRGDIGEMERCIRSVLPAFHARDSFVPFVILAVPAGDASISATCGPRWRPPPFRPSRPDGTRGRPSAAALALEGSRVWAFRLGLGGDVSYLPLPPFRYVLRTSYPPSLRGR